MRNSAGIEDAVIGGAIGAPLGSAAPPGSAAPLGSAPPPHSRTSTRLTH
ncbi:hypothetical protein ACFXG6_03555 [Streptomyces roseus]